MVGAQKKGEMLGSGVDRSSPGGYGDPLRDRG